MSTIVCLKEEDLLLLATDSRFMNPDQGVATDSGQKIFEIAPQTFIAPSGWKMASDFQLAKARELVGTLGTSDIRVVAEALGREAIPNLEDLAEILRSMRQVHEKIAGALDGRLMLGTTVLAGRTAAGELGYIKLVFRIQAGRVVCASNGEYFGRASNVYVSSGDPVALI